MTRVLLVIGATTGQAMHRLVQQYEVAEADIVIGTNEEVSEGVVLKDRWGKDGVPVKIVNP